ncbi:unnamed protein product [Rhizophagus irregularis]|nr:unnamed protein product [Rhizophagus irregularis]
MSDAYDELEEIKERYEIEKHNESREEYQVDPSCLKCHSIVEIKMEQMILKRDINDFMGDDMIPEIFIRKKENNKLLKNKHNRNKKTVLEKYEIQRMISIKELKNFREVRSFMKLCCQYRRFMKEMSKKARPLSRLLKEKTRFIWKEEQRKAFEILKEELKISIKKYIRKSYKGKNNNYGINYEEDNKNFQRKRLQAEYERKSLGNDENFDYRSVIIDIAKSEENTKICEGAEVELTEEEILRMISMRYMDREILDWKFIKLFQENKNELEGVIKEVLDEYLEGRVKIEENNREEEDLDNSEKVGEILDLEEYEIWEENTKDFDENEFENNNNK